MKNNTIDNEAFNQTLDEKKQQFLAQKELQEEEIFDRIASIKSEAIEKLKIVASIGSVAIGAYLVLKYFFGNKDFTLSELMPSLFEGDGNEDKNELESEGKSAQNFGLDPKHTQENSYENGILC